MPETKIKILRGASSLFMKFGFKSITMDDIARELGISKKTLYQYFEDKTKLVDEAVEQHLQEEINCCEEIKKQGSDPVSFILNITDSISERDKQINPSVLFDLKKSFKPAWDKLYGFRTNYVYNKILSNLEQGKKKGFYNKDINEKLIARLYIHLIDFLISPELYMNESKDFQEVHFEIIKYHLRGICTEKGLEILNEKLKKRR